MKRRDFLQQTLAGGAAAWAHAASPGSGAEAPAQQQGAAGVLITSAQTPLARRLAAGLAETFSLRLTATTDVETELPFLRCDLAAGEETAAVVRWIRAIVHVPPPVSPAEEAALVEQWPRQTYNLLQAAASAGVQRVVYLSSLDVVSGYDPQYLVDEDWQPRVESGTGQLPHYLGEFCCREFARERKLQVIALRLGRLSGEPQIEAARGPASPRPAGLGGDPQGEAAEDPDGLHVQDAVQAVRLALAAEAVSGRGIDSWSVCHVTSGLPGSRFPLQRAKQVLGYEPRFGAGKGSASR